MSERGMEAEMQRALKRITQVEFGGRRQSARNDLKTITWMIQKTLAWRGIEAEEHVLWGKANELTPRR